MDPCASLSALVGFLLGAGLSGRFSRPVHNRAHLLRNTVAVELALMTVASAILGRGEPDWSS